MLKLGQQIGSKNQIKCLQLLVKLHTRIVELPMGKVKGRQQRSINKNDYYSFEGIPYGKPPLGELRFQAPQLAEPWVGKELNCQQERCRPVQMEGSSDSVLGNEDCLHLNVYTKKFDSEKPLPVIVYIYGGAFRTGGATKFKYGPDFLMREDIVYVLFNYRLCALGFLRLPSAETCVPGNAGLLDQLMALRWVKNNICYFNGDPDNITLMGTSAGAASVHFMMCLPQAKDLFHKAIMMSGTILSPWAQASELGDLFCRLAHSTGYKGDLTETAILKYLRELPADQLVQHDLYGPYERCFGHLHPFVPGVESTGGGLVQHSYLQLMRQAWSTQIPLLLGGTSFEGLVMYPHCKLCNGYMLDLIKQQPALVLPYELYQSLSQRDRNERAKELIHFHYGPRNIDKNNVTQLLDLFSYKLFWHGLHRVVCSRLVHAEAATYLYRFDFDSPSHNLMREKLCGDDIKRGVCHADDLGYIFPRQNQLITDSDEHLTMHRMIGILTTFARTGDPNCDETHPEVWIPLDQKEPFKVMNIGHDVEFQTQMERDGLKIWNKIYDNDSNLLFGG